MHPVSANDVASFGKVVPVRQSPSISVAMATFNGAPYILAQLQSLAKQSILPNELVVSDDGSTDATLDIIEQFSLSAPFKVLINRNAVRLGFADNFLKAAQLTNSRWIAFCDQDDIWFPRKIETVLKTIGSDEELHLIVHTSKILRGDTLTTEIVGPKNAGLHLPLTLHPLHVFNGHALVFDRVLLDVLRVEARPFSPHTMTLRMPHDDWITFLGGALGKTHILKEPLVQYRHHEGNISSPSSKREDIVSQWRRARLINYAAIQKGLFGAEQRAFQLSQVKSDLEHIRSNAERAVAYYREIALLTRIRLDLWQAKSFRERSLIAMHLLKRGAYRTFPNGGVGAREAIKDLLFGVFLKR